MSGIFQSYQNASELQNTSINSSNSKIYNSSPKSTSRSHKNASAFHSALTNESSEALPSSSKNPSYFKQNILHYQEIASPEVDLPPSQTQIDQTQLLDKITLLTRKNNELTNEINYLQDQVQVFQNSSSQPQNFSLLQDVNRARSEITTLRNELKAQKSKSETSQAEVQRLKQILNFREKQLQIAQEKPEIRKQESQKLGVETRNLIEINRKLSEKLYKTREKVTREQFLQLQQEKITEAVETETRIIYEQKAEVLNMLQETQLELQKQKKIVRILEKEACKSIESTDFSFRKQLAEYKNDILEMEKQMQYKDQQLAQMRNQVRNCESQMLIFKDVSELKSERINAHLDQNNQLRLEMKMRNFETKNVLKNASLQISEKLQLMKKENQRIMGDYQEVIRTNCKSTRAEEKLRDIYDQLDEMKEFVK